MGIVTDGVLPLALAFIIFSLGLGLTAQDFLRVARQPPWLFRGRAVAGYPAAAYRPGDLPGRDAALIQERENIVSYLGQSSPVIRSPMDTAAETGRRC